MNLTNVLFAFVVGGLATVATGCYFVMRGLRGIKEKTFPLTDHQNIHGTSACLAGGLMALLGILAILSGIAVAAFCAWRITTLTS